MKQAHPFQEPTLEEWLAFCHEQWPWMPKAHAEQSWGHYHFGAVDGQWVQKDRTPIKSWKQCANTSHGLFLKLNPDAKARWQRMSQTAARASAPAAAPEPEKVPWMQTPEWKAHLAKYQAQGKGVAQAMLTFVAPQ